MLNQPNHQTASKKRSAANSTKHGVFTHGIMSCKKIHCYYAELCPLCNLKEKTFNTDISYGDDCPIETDLFKSLKNNFVSAVNVSQEETKNNMENIVILILQIRRAQMMNAINPDFVRQVPSRFPGYTKPAFSLGVRYKRELSALLYKEIAQLIDDFNQKDLENKA